MPLAAHAISPVPAGTAASDALDAETQGLPLVLADPVPQPPERPEP